ncbi:MAG TPA: AAA family ATPase, partial [Burkholderiales bacterium]|nr:AAA family ATPase [Burkholderiales bacterium]
MKTKLHPPTVPADLVPRERLLNLLEAGRGCPLTLVSAPAGYGKSALIAWWIEHCDWLSAWLSLNEDDSDLRQFLIYFAAAVRNVFPDACEQTQRLAGATQLPPLREIALILTNDLDALDQPLFLVLDDYHSIGADSPVNDLLQRILERPPIPLHLVIVTRRDPSLALAGLR